MAKRPPELSTCLFSEDGVYRYTLEHRWDEDTPSYARKTVVWVMLNPSTADGQSLDPTLRRCKGFSKALGAGGMVILNLFAYRATLPKDMLAAEHPIGPLNDETIRRTVERDGVIATICGWGTHGAHRGRDAEVKAMLATRALCALRLTKDGHPSHPLYLPSTCAPIPFGFAPQPCSSPPSSSPSASS